MSPTLWLLLRCRHKSLRSITGGRWLLSDLNSLLMMGYSDRKSLSVAVFVTSLAVSRECCFLCSIIPTAFSCSSNAAIRSRSRVLMASIILFSSAVTFALIWSAVSFTSFMVVMTLSLNSCLAWDEAAKDSSSSFISVWQTGKISFIAFLYFREASALSMYWCSGWRWSTTVQSRQIKTWHVSQ